MIGSVEAMDLRAVNWSPSGPFPGPLDLWIEDHKPFKLFSIL